MRYKVLTVDDSKTVRIIVKKAFKPFDCEIFEAANGVEGLAVAAKENPDLILLDVTMPVMDGVEMLTKLKADPALKAIPVVMLTSSHDERDISTAYDLGANAYVVKPVSFTEFRQALKEVGSFWAVINELPPQTIVREVGSPTNEQAT